VPPRRCRTASLSASPLALALALALALVLAPREAIAEQPGATAATATMTCERAAEPGRVRCAVEARAREGHTLAWADVAIVELPDFASALKGRIGADALVAQDALSRKWAFGVVAKTAGQGNIRARVRMVVCDADSGGSPRCSPATLDVQATIHVG
jgi:hypothetical protein